MWYLTSDSDTRVIYIISSNSVTIGRSIEAQSCDFAISDQSISRKHAILAICNNYLTLEDLGSRYGTFVNDSNDKMEPNIKVSIKAGDIIKFGKFSSIWKTHEINFITCTSTLKGENLTNLKSFLGKIGGTLKSDWDDSCSYLTMPGITLTIKVVLALVQGSFIVTTEFWQKCVESVESNSKLPEALNFIPQVVESTLNKEHVSFLPNTQRKTLFSAKTFVFFTRKQLDMYKTVLTKSSGSALLLSESKLTKSMLCDKNMIVIQYYSAATSQETQAQRDQINEIVNYLKSNNKRLVADAEIGLAVLYCSVEKYCNPDFNFPNEVIKQTEQTNSKVNVLVPETQESNTGPVKLENMVINESLKSKDVTCFNNLSSKRKLHEDVDMTNPSKKLATEFISNRNITCESSKRKFEDDHGTSQINPSKRVAVGEDNNEDEDFFKFVDKKSNSVNKEASTQKKLNFKQLVKNNTNVSDDEENPFDFMREKPKISENTNNAILKNSPKSSSKCHKDEPTAEEVNIDELRGCKLKELMESNLHSDTFTKVKTIKLEVTDDIGESLRNLYLGSTIVKIRPNLIVKKEALETEPCKNELKNFKKFKKVWPIRMQQSVTALSTSA